MATSLRDVLLERVVDADPELPEDADGGPPARPEERPKQRRAPVRLENTPKDGSPSSGESSTA